MKLYIVVWAETIEELEHDVGLRMAEGYIPQGGVCCALARNTIINGIVEHREQFYVQAMILEAP